MDFSSYGGFIVQKRVSLPAPHDHIWWIQKKRTSFASTEEADYTSAKKGFVDIYSPRESKNTNGEDACEVPGNFQKRS